MQRGVMYSGRDRRRLRKNLESENGSAGELRVEGPVFHQRDAGSLGSRRTSARVGRSVVCAEGRPAVGAGRREIFPLLTYC